MIARSGDNNSTEVGCSQKSVPMHQPGGIALVDWRTNRHPCSLAMLEGMARVGATFVLLETSQPIEQPL